MGDEMRVPQPGEGWRHYKNEYPSLYEIVGVGHDTETGHAVVIYREWDAISEADRLQLWSRPLNVFLGYTDDHKRRFRFERVAPGERADG